MNRRLEKRLEALEGDGDALSLEDVYRWIQAIDEDPDVGRPPEFFGSEDGALEWTDEVRDMHAAISDWSPTLEDVSPAEAFALAYLDEETSERVAKLIETDSGGDPEL